MNILPRNLFVFISFMLFTAQPAYATAYYIDSELGNDSWSGKTPAPSGNPAMDGPWQTLGRLANISLSPNDIVYLACSANWNETLRVPSSGTSGNPIVVSAGPNHCDTRPAIDGVMTIPGPMWTQYSGAIYRARLPIEYISNPGLNENLNGWNNWSQGNDASMSLDPVCSGSPLPCMQFTSGTGTNVYGSVVISNNFPLAGGMNYSASVLVKAPAGTRLRFVIRRGGPTYESLTTDQPPTVTGSGNWQTVSFAFRAARSAPNARFDIEVPDGKVVINLREAHVQRVLPASGVIGVFVDGTAVRRAHHPNFGQANTNPNSLYGTLASAVGNRILDTSGLALPANASLSPGLGVSIRVNNYVLNERKIASLQGTLLVLDQDTDYPITAKYGYFLTGALWMLDSPGEWYFDSANNDLYIWMPEGNAPGNRVAFNSLALGADLTRKSYIDLVGLDIRRVGTGVQLGGANTVRLRDVQIAEIADHGVDAANSLACTVEQSSIVNTGLDAITAVGAATTGFTVSDSRVFDSGTLDRTDSWRKLPRPALAAINVGANSSILRNTVLGAANNGMYMGQNSVIANNHVSRACTLFNDCGGIVSNYTSTGTSINGNVVDTIIGGLAGLPANAFTQTAGIYLDDHSVNIEVRENTITGADYGIHMHDAYNSTVSANVLFGNRRYQLWMQEQTARLRATGDIFGNQIESNLLVPLAGGPSVFMESEIGDTGDFATFSGNHYSALLSPRLVGERWPTGSNSFTLGDWQAAKQDISGRVTQPVGYASFLSNGANIVPNGNLANNITGWTWWNSTAPYAQPVLLSCSFGPCLQLTAGATLSLLASPNFSVTGEQWYRVSFDAITSQEGQPISVIVRRGGGGSAGYEALVPAAESFPGSTTWRRYSFVFQAAKTVIANDPATGELGARIDFGDIQPGSSITVATLEIVPLTRSQAATQLRLQVNPSGTSTTVPCSPDDAASNLCNKFVYMKDDSVLDWSSLVPAYSGNAIYTRDMTLVDTDYDGVADVEDACPKTPAGVAVNARGCSFGGQ